AASRSCALCVAALGQSDGRMGRGAGSGRAARPFDRRRRRKANQLQVLERAASARGSGPLSGGILSSRSGLSGTYSTMMTSARSKDTSLGLCAALLVALGCGGKASEAVSDTREESDDGASSEDDGQTSDAAEAGSDAAGERSAAEDSGGADSDDSDSEGDDSEGDDSDNSDAGDDGDATDEDALGDAASSSEPATEPASTQLGSLTITQLPGGSPSP